MIDESYLLARNPPAFAHAPALNPICISSPGCQNTSQGCRHRGSSNPQDMGTVAKRVGSVKQGATQHPLKKTAGSRVVDILSTKRLAGGSGRDASTTAGVSLTTVVRLPGHFSFSRRERTDSSGVPSAYRCQPDTQIVWAMSGASPGNRKSSPDVSRSHQTRIEVMHECTKGGRKSPHLLREDEHLGVLRNGSVPCHC